MKNLKVKDTTYPIFRKFQDLFQKKLEKKKKRLI